MNRGFLIFCLILLHACDSPQIEQTANEIKSQPASLEPAKAEKLNLDISAEMMEEALDSSDANEIDADIKPVLNLHRSKEHQRIHLKGEILMDEAEENYKKAANGVVLEVEIDFE